MNALKVRAGRQGCTEAVHYSPFRSIFNMNAVKVPACCEQVPRPSAAVAGWLNPPGA